jgi:carbamoyltransferase
MSAVVLGVNLGHDRSACLAIDGKPQVAIAEERLTRIKHDIPVNRRNERYNFFPRRSADYCLDACGLGYGDVDLVVASTTYVLDTTDGRRRNLRADDIRWQCPELASARIETALHHLAHAGSVALCSGWPSAAVLVIDGGGSVLRYDGGTATEFERTSIFHFRAGQLKPVRQVVGGPPAYGNSIGDFYQLVTTYLGFRAGEEGKTMGLAGYSDAAAAGWAPLDDFKDAIVVEPDGSHQVCEMFQFDADGAFSPRLTSAFGMPRRRPVPDVTLDRHIAASAQWAIEEAILQLADVASRRTGESRLCLAGGVALNCVANGRVLREGSFEELFIQPAAGDDGTALGNAQLGFEMLTGRSADWVFRSAHLGRTYSEHDITAALDRFGCDVLVTRPPDVPDALAADIADGRIVALFRGGCEYGPRALGHRSILCDPRTSGMTDQLNMRVKHREPFRPFAPIVLEESASYYFDLGVPSPYMLLAASVLQPDAVPAITHVDGSARVQTVNRSQDPFLYAVVSRFADRTGVPVVLNTSFNDQEPIVETPLDALRCFLSTGIDMLYLGDRCVEKAGL